MIKQMVLAVASKLPGLLKGAVDRAAHPVRRARLRRRLRGRPSPRAVLFLCHGNICRSPYAAAAFRRALPDLVRDTITIDSAGLIGAGRRAPSEARTAAATHGIDLTAHCSKLVSPELLEDTDLIVVMDARQRAALVNQFSCDTARTVVLGDADPGPIRRRTIHDPVLQSEAVFETTYVRIDRCVAELVAMLRLA